jgi:hypothetical protein
VRERAALAVVLSRCLCALACALVCLHVRRLPRCLTAPWQQVFRGSDCAAATNLVLDGDFEAPGAVRAWTAAVGANAAPPLGRFVVRGAGGVVALTGAATGSGHGVNALQLGGGAVAEVTLATQPGQRYTLLLQAGPAAAGGGSAVLDAQVLVGTTARGAATAEAEAVFEPLRMNPSFATGMATWTVGEWASGRVGEWAGQVAVQNVFSVCCAWWRDLVGGGVVCDIVVVLFLILPAAACSPPLATMLP